MNSSIVSLLASYRRAGNWFLPVLRERRELARLPIARIGPCDVHFALGGGEYLAVFGILPRRETLRQRALRLCVGIAAGPFGAVLPLQPDAAAGKDTSLLKSSSTYNYGSTTSMLLRSAGTFEYRGLIQFDISSVPIAAKISLSVMSFYLFGGSSTANTTVNINRSLVSWFEGVKNGSAPDAGQDGSTWLRRNANGPVDWGAQGGLSGTDYDATVSATNVFGAYSTWHDFTITTLCQAWLKGTYANYGVWMISSGTAMDKYVYSSDYATAANRPLLTITYSLPAGGGAIRSPFGGAFGGIF